jgi:NADH:ubiquinone oxidoreductase subunit H
MRLALSRVLLLVVLLLTGCGLSEPAPGLLNTVDFAPRAAEVGDRLEIIGTGFPEGKPATLSFRGDLYRPGQEPLRDVDIAVGATSTSQNRISVILSEDIQSRFCGRGEAADHTTFRGDVVTVFAARTAGAPPVSGVVRDVVLDVNGPAVSTEIQTAREEEAKLALSFLGIEIDEARSGPPTITKVKPGGRADRAGLLDDDVLVSVEGVNVRSLSDVTFSGATRLAKVAVRRGRLKEPVERVVDVQGFRKAAPKELAYASVLIGIVAMLFVFWMAPIGRLFGWIERRVAARLRERRRVNGNGPLARAGRLLSTMHESLNEGLVPEGEPFVLRLVPYLSFLAISAGATTVAFGRPLVSRDLDLGLSYGVSLTLLMTVALMAGGWRGRGRWSLAAGMKSAFGALALQLPVLIAFACVVLASGSVRISDAVGMQSALPWGWNAFKNPALFLAFGLLVVSSIPQSRRDGELGDADLESRAAGGGILFYAEWCHLLVVSTLGAVLFLGGWQLPKSLVPPSGMTLGWQAAGAVLLQVKTWGVAGVIVTLRWALPRVRVDQMLGIFWRWLLPATFVALGGSVIWASSLHNPTMRSVEPMLGHALFGLTLGVALKFARAVQTHVRATAAPMHVNPWL